MGFIIKEGSETRVSLAGKLDFARAPELMDALATLKGKDIQSIIFDISPGTLVKICCCGI